MQFSKGEFRERDIGRMGSIGSIEDVMYGSVVKAFGEPYVRDIDVNRVGSVQDFGHKFSWYLKADGHPIHLWFKTKDILKLYGTIARAKSNPKLSQTIIPYIEVMGYWPDFILGFKNNKQREWCDNLIKELKNHIQLKNYGLSKDSEDMFGDMLRSI
jgi:hypothetical protein